MRTTKSCALMKPLHFHFDKESYSMFPLLFIIGLFSVLCVALCFTIKLIPVDLDFDYTPDDVKEKLD